MIRPGVLLQGRYRVVRQIGGGGFGQVFEVDDGGTSKVLNQQRDRGIVQSTRASLPPKVANRLSHPYYWAPFILIGNGL